MTLYLVCEISVDGKIKVVETYYFHDEAETSQQSGQFILVAEAK